MTIHSAPVMFLFYSGNVTKQFANPATASEFCVKVLCWKFCLFGVKIFAGLLFSFIWLCFNCLWIFVLFGFFVLLLLVSCGVFLIKWKNNTEISPHTWCKLMWKTAGLLSPYQAEIGNHLLKWPIIKHYHCFGQTWHTIRQRASSPLLDLSYPSVFLFRKQITFLSF